MATLRSLQWADLRLKYASAWEFRFVKYTHRDEEPCLVLRLFLRASSAEEIRDELERERASVNGGGAIQEVVAAGIIFKHLAAGKYYLRIKIESPLESEKLLKQLEDEIRAFLIEYFKHNGMPEPIIEFDRS